MQSARASVTEVMVTALLFCVYSSGWTNGQSFSQHRPYCQTGSLRGLIWLCCGKGFMYELIQDLPKVFLQPPPPLTSAQTSNIPLPDIQTFPFHVLSLSSPCVSGRGSILSRCVKRSFTASLRHSLCLSHPFSLSGVRLLIMQEDYLIYVSRRH